MRRLLPWSIAAAVLLLSLSSCVMTPPLSDATLSDPVPELCGVWQGTTDKTRTLTVGLLHTEAGAPQGLMTMVLPVYDPHDKTITLTNCEFFVTTLGGTTYANMLPLGSEWPNIATAAGYQKWIESGDARRIQLTKYKLDGATLTVWDGNDTAFEKLAKEKNLNTSIALVTYLKAHGDAEIFPPTDKIIYQRVNP